MVGFAAKSTIIPGIRTILACLLVSAMTYGQNTTAERPQMADEVFKNVQVLKGIPVNEFLGIMGFFSASLGKSCVDCHDSDSGWENYVADKNPNKRTTRRMIEMVSTINKNFFGGAQGVTCYSCHRGGPSPKLTPNLTALYSPPAETEADDVVQQAPGAPSADQILDKYLQALGGAQRVAGLTSFAAKGTTVDYGLDAEKRPLEIFAKAPDQRATVIQEEKGTTTTIYDGRSGWIAAPNLPLPVLPLTGGELDGAGLDAALSFPARIKQAFTRWRVGVPVDIEDREVQVLQGTTAAGNIATLYFDSKSGLLMRIIRYARSPVGRLPTQIDYSEYRDVAGVKMPFRWNILWLDGRETVELTEVRPNVPIDNAKFAKPAPPGR